MKPNLSEEDFLAILRGERKEFILNRPSGGKEKTIFLKNYNIGFVNSEQSKYGSITTNHSIEIEDCDFVDLINLSIKCKNLIKFEKCRFYDYFGIFNLECDRFIMNKCKVDKESTIGGCKSVSLEFNTEFGAITFADNIFTDFKLSGIYSSIRLLNSTFINSFRIHDANIEGFIFDSNVDKDQRNVSFRFIDSTFRDKVIFKKGFFSDIIIKNSDFGDFSIEGGEFNKLTINNKDKFFKGLFTISGGDFKDDFRIEGGKFENEIKFDGGKFKNLIFKDGNFSRVLFRGGTFDGFISIRGGKYDDVTFKGGIYTRYVDFWGRKEEKNSEFVIKKINIVGGDFKENIWIKDGKIEELNIQPLLMSRIHILPNYDSKYSLSPPEIKNLTITTYFYKDSFLQISDVSLKKLSFSNFTNMATITIANVSLKELEIKNTDLGKTTFINCDFSEIKFTFKSSKITDTSLNGTPLPVDIIADDNIQKRLALSQIKKIYENRGDLVEAGKYYAKEMNVYLGTLPKSWEKVNVWLNKWTNNHGQSWQCAFAVTIFISLLFFLFYTWSLYYTFECNYFIKADGYSFLLDYKPFKDNLKYFFEFFNPTHKFDFISEKKPILNFWSGFWDFFSRVLIGYGIYQFIAAFRKHGKKS